MRTVINGRATLYCVSLHFRLQSPFMAQCATLKNDERTVEAAKIFNSFC